MRSAKSQRFCWNGMEVVIKPQTHSHKKRRSLLEKSPSANINNESEEVSSCWVDWRVSWVDWCASWFHCLLQGILVELVRGFQKCEQFCQRDASSILHEVCGKKQISLWARVFKTNVPCPKMNKKQWIWRGEFLLSRLEDCLSRFEFRADFFDFLISNQLIHAFDYGGELNYSFFRLSFHLHLFSNGFLVLYDQFQDFCWKIIITG